MSMTLPHPDYHHDLNRALNEELMKDLPNAKLKHERLPSSPPPVAGSPPPPVDPKAGAGGGKWGPSSPSPSVLAQVDCIRNDTQRLIEVLHDLQAGLTLIRDRLGGSPSLMF